MDARNIEALSYGAEWLLAKFANLPAVNAGKAVEDFIRSYGEVYPGWDTSAEPLYAHYANEFRRAWHAKSRAEKERISQLLTGIFEREITAETLGLLRAEPFDDPHDPQFRPAVVADFETGKIGVKPRTLLDYLAKWLLDYRDKLALCERKDCTTPYYVKAHPRYRYCSQSCGYTVRKKGKRQWWREKRGKDREQRKQRKRRK